MDAANPFAPPPKPVKPARGSAPPNPFAAAATVAVAASKLSAALGHPISDENHKTENPFAPAARAPPIGNPFQESVVHAAPTGGPSNPFAPVRANSKTNPFAPERPAQRAAPPHYPVPDYGDVAAQVAPALLVPPLPPIPHEEPTTPQMAPPVPPPIPPLFSESPSIAARAPPIPELPSFSARAPPIPMVPPSPRSPDTPAVPPPVPPPVIPSVPLISHPDPFVASSAEPPSPFSFTTADAESDPFGFPVVTQAAFASDPFGSPTVAGRTASQPFAPTVGNSFSFSLAPSRDPFAPTSPGAPAAPAPPVPVASAAAPAIPQIPQIPAIHRVPSMSSSPTSPPAAPPIPPAMPTTDEEDPHAIGLPTLAPQLDDDPYDLHIEHAPAPALVPVTAAPPTRQPSIAAPAPKSAAFAGDPFEVLVPLKPAAKAEPRHVVGGIPLKAMLPDKLVPAMTSMPTVAALRKGPANPFAPAVPAAPVAPVAPVSQSAPAVPAFLPVGLVPQAPTAAPADPFSSTALLQPEKHAVPQPSPAQHVHAAPPGAPTPTVHDLDFLAFTSKPVAKATAGTPSAPPVPSSDFGDFSAPTRGPGFDDFSATFGAVDDPFGAPAPDDFFAPSAPAPAPAFAFSAPPAPGPARSVQRRPSATNPPPVSAAKIVAAHSAEVESDDFMDVFNAPSKPAGPPPAPADPFGSSADHDDFAFGSDPFGASDDPFAQDEESVEEKMRRLRAAYNLPSDHSDNDEDDDAHPIPKAVPPVRSRGSVPEELTKLEGDVLTRLSAKSMMTKDWHEHFFVVDKGILCLYKTRLDYEYNPAGTNCKKKIPITHCMRVLQIKAKEYKGFGTLHNFMLEEILDYGTTNIGKFASANQATAQALWKKIRQIILFRREQRARQLKNV